MLSYTVRLYIDEGQRSINRMIKQGYSTTVFVVSQFHITLYIFSPRAGVRATTTLSACVDLLTLSHGQNSQQHKRRYGRRTYCNLSDSDSTQSVHMQTLESPDLFVIAARHVEHADCMSLREYVL